MNFSTRTAVLPRRPALAGRVAAIAIAAVVAVVLAPGAALAQSQYTIASGDTLAGIAAAHGSSVQAIADANGIADVDLIIAGNTLTIPGGSAPAADEAPAPAPEPEPAPEPAPAAASGGVWDRLAQCESGGNWSINTGNGYYGGLQFSESSWHAVGGTGLPHEHSRDTQIAMAERLLDVQGWGAWPACSAKLGLR